MGVFGSELGNSGCMPIISDDYRQQAEFCERMAHRAESPELKASWLRLAADWLALIDKAERRGAEDGNGSGRPKTAEEDFEDISDALSTGQKDSTSSH